MGHPVVSSFLVADSLPLSQPESVSDVLLNRFPKKHLAKPSRPDGKWGERGFSAEWDNFGTQFKIFGKFSAK